MLIRIIGGRWKRTRLPVLQAAGLRPTPNRVRETIFNWLGPSLDGLVCLDLFAGSGALGFEAGSRGAAHVLMVERCARIAQQLRANRAKLAAYNVDIVQANALRFATTLTAQRFDIVFLDPPFQANILGQALRLSLPLVRAGGAITIEAPTGVDPLVLAEAANSAQPPGCTTCLSLNDWRIVHRKKAGAVHYYLLRSEFKEIHGEKSDGRCSLSRHI